MGCPEPLSRVAYHSTSLTKLISVRRSGGRTRPSPVLAPPASTLSPTTLTFHPPPEEQASTVDRLRTGASVGARGCDGELPRPGTLQLRMT